MTINGATPANHPTCTRNLLPKAWVRFEDRAQGYRFDFPVPCASGNLRWSGFSYRGTYRVTVEGDAEYGLRNGLPISPYVVSPRLAVP